MERFYHQSITPGGKHKQSSAINGAPSLSDSWVARLKCIINKQRTSEPSGQLKTNTTSFSVHLYTLNTLLIEGKLL